MIKCVVTGGAGFIGSHLVEQLARSDFQVLVIDKVFPPPDYLKRLDSTRVLFWQCDIADEYFLRKYLRWFNPKYIFHLAAEARIQPSFGNPDEYFKSNVLGTRNVLKISREIGVQRIVYSASSSAYGEQKRMLLEEDMAISPLSFHPYGSTKRIGEMLMSDMGKMTGGPETVSLRYFNVYGPRQPAEGEYATVVGIFLRQQKNGEFLTIVPDGYQRRDFTHVSDVVRANILAMLSPKVGNAEIINIGTGVNYSVWDAVKIILGVPVDSDVNQLIGSGLCKMLEPRRGEVRQTLADIAKAKNLLDWEPLVSFREGIELTKKEFY